MYVQISLKSIEPISVHDNPFVLIDKRIELYQTWQLTGLEKLEDNQTASYVRQGFSLLGADNHNGTFFREDDGVEKVWDPYLRFLLPELSNDGDARTYKLDFHHWEHDSRKSTKRVRAAFSDSTIETLKSAWIAAGEDNELAKKALLKYLEDLDLDEVISSHIAKLSLPAKYTKWIYASKDLIPLLKLVVNVLKNKRDDYLSSHRMEFQIKNEGGNFQWRFNDPQNDINNFKNSEGQQLIEMEARNHDGKNRFKVVYQCRIID